MGVCSTSTKYVESGEDVEKNKKNRIKSGGKDDIIEKLETKVVSNSLKIFLPSHLLSEVISQSLKFPLGDQNYSWKLEDKTMALMVDISGFTNLSEQLRKESSQGEQKLKWYINDYFNGITEEIRLFGGDIEIFAGDAVIAFFHTDQVDGRNDQSRYLETARNILICSQEIRNKYGSYTVYLNQETQKLHLHMGISMSSAERMIIGGGCGDSKKGKGVFLTSGGIFQGLDEVMTVSSSGDVVVHSSIHKLLGEGDDKKKLIEWEETNNGHFKLLNCKGIEAVTSSPRNEKTYPIEIEEAFYSTFIDPYIQNRVFHNQIHTISELKEISILFIKIQPFFEDNSKNGNDFLADKTNYYHSIISSLQEKTTDFGGTIISTFSDEKGCFSIIVFGYPFYSESDSLKSMRCAISISEQMREKVSIGVARGRTYCGLVGDSERKSVTVLGDSVNLSARLSNMVSKILQQEDHIRVLCDKKTFEENKNKKNKNSLKIEEVGKFSVKGKTKKISIFHPLSYKEEEEEEEGEEEEEKEKEEEDMFIGRKLELMKLKSYFFSSSSQKTDDVVRLFQIFGERGVGKTRLLKKFQEMIQQETTTRLLFLFISGEEIEKMNNYYIIKLFIEELIEVSLEVESKENLESYIEKNQESITSGLSEHHLNALRSIITYSSSSSQGVRRRRPRVLRQIFLELIQFFIDKKIENFESSDKNAKKKITKMVVVFDGFSLFDAESKIILRQLFASSSSKKYDRRHHKDITFITSSRKKLDNSNSNHNNNGCLQLDNFSKDEIHQFLQTFFRVEFVDYEVVEYLFSRSLGNPLILQEIVRFLDLTKSLYVEKNKLFLLLLLQQEEKHRRLVMNNQDGKNNSSKYKDIILTKLDSLDLRLKEFVKNLSILCSFQNRCNVSEIAVVLEKKEEECEEILKILIDQHFVQKNEMLEYGFVYFESVEVITDSILSERKSDLHFKIYNYLTKTKEYKEEQVVMVKRVEFHRFEYISHFKITELRHLESEIVVKCYQKNGELGICEMKNRNYPHSLLFFNRSYHTLQLLPKLLLEDDDDKNLENLISKSSEIELLLNLSTTYSRIRELHGQKSSDKIMKYLEEAEIIINKEEEDKGLLFEVIYRKWREFSYLRNMEKMSEYSETLLSYLIEMEKEERKPVFSVYTYQSIALTAFENNDFEKFQKYVSNALNSYTNFILQQQQQQQQHEKEEEEEDKQQLFSSTNETVKRMSLSLLSSENEEEGQHPVLNLLFLAGKVYFRKGIFGESKKMYRLAEDFVMLHWPNKSESPKKTEKTFFRNQISKLFYLIEKLRFLGEKNGKKEEWVKMYDHELIPILEVFKKEERKKDNNLLSLRFLVEDFVSELHFFKLFIEKRFDDVGKKHEKKEEEKNNNVGECIRYIRKVHPVVLFLYGSTLLQNDQITELLDLLKSEISEPEKNLHPELLKLEALGREKLLKINHDIEEHHEEEEDEGESEEEEEKKEKIIIIDDGKENLEKKERMKRIEGTFLKSIEVARTEGSKMFVLRSQLSLSEFWMKNGMKRGESVNKLRSILSGFVEKNEEVIESEKVASDLINKVENTHKSKNDDFFLTYKQLVEQRNRGNMVMKMGEKGMYMMMKMMLAKFKKKVEKESIQEGDVMPPFELLNRKGEIRKLEEILLSSSGGGGSRRGRPLVINFFRGSWCPYCTSEVCGLDDSYSRILALGASLVSIGPDLNSVDEFRDRDGIVSEILLDRDGKYAKKVGLMVEQKGMMKMMEKKGMGLDLEKINGRKLGWKLPVPGTYIVGEDGIVVKRFVDVEFWKRMEPDDIIEVLKGLFDKRMKKKKI